MTLAGRALSSEQKRAIVERIYAAWIRMPEQRLGQLLVNAHHDMMFLREDDLLAADVEKFVERVGRPPEDAPVTPEGFREYLGPYGAVMYDAACGQPIAWGFPLVRHVGERRGELERHGTLECVGGLNPTWVLATRYLEVGDAIRTYGPVTNLETGPRGGFRSVTYGTTRFVVKWMDPRKATT